MRRRRRRRRTHATRQHTMHMEEHAGAHLPTACNPLNAEPKNRTESTIDMNFLSVVTRMVVTADVNACRRYTPKMQTTYRR